MEDAMILNKSAVDRGLSHATMLKTEQVDLGKESGSLCPSGFVACILHAEQCLERSEQALDLCEEGGTGRLSCNVYS